MSVLLSIFSIALTVMVSLSLWIGQPVAQAMPLEALPAVLPGLKGVFTGTRPDHLGVQAGQLASCPETPNCVVSQTTDPEHAIAPFTYTTDRGQARDLLIAILNNQPRTRIVEQTEDYVAAEFTSRLMGFVDDAEFYFPQDQKVIHVRSAARLGESDLGVNRRRLEQFRLALQTLEAAA